LHTFEASGFRDATAAPLLQACFWCEEAILKILHEKYSLAYQEILIPLKIFQLIEDLGSVKAVLVLGEFGNLH
jgi:hypothetical protein